MLTTGEYINYGRFTVKIVVKTAELQLLRWNRWALLIRMFNSVQSLSHVQLCNPMDCSMPGLPVHHRLPQFTQTHVHWVSDAIQPSHLLSSLLLPSIFPNIRVFSNESFLRIRWPKCWSFSLSISPMYILPWGMRKENQCNRNNTGESETPCLGSEPLRWF